jgi:LytS/YehU family sensor histidine kinase
LTTEIGIDPAALTAPVPPMLVQTLVENGIKHGIARLPEGGRITVRAEIVDGDLRIEVINSGTLGAGSDGERVGLANARDRLRLLFGPDAGLELAEPLPGTVAAEVRIPLSTRIEHHAGDHHR